MKVLLVGATGYIGRRILQKMQDSPHELVVLTRSAQRLHLPQKLKEKLTIIEGDLLDPKTLTNLPSDIEVVYYLAHSMKDSSSKFEELEKKCIHHLLSALNHAAIKQVIYLTGLVSNQHLSRHLQSRLDVENIIKESSLPYTILRAGIIIGSGSASFEIIRDLVEKLPIMVAPKWVLSRCQPIAIDDILYFLIEVLGNDKCINHVFDVGGDEILSYKDMLLNFAKFRGLKRYIFKVPVLTPRLSSYWLYFVTATNYSLASSLVDSLKNDAICTEERRIQKVIPRKCWSYKQALERAFMRIEQNSVISSWKDAYNNAKINPDVNEYIRVPEYGCLTFKSQASFTKDRNEVIEKLWTIGGNNGWYTTDWAWKLRGEIDKLFGGVGIRRGRRNQKELYPGDALDFWRVLLADKDKGLLLLYAEMKIPGQAWLQFYIKPISDTQGGVVKLKATFRPKGVLGRFYWYILYPIHLIIFPNMCKNLIK